MEQLGLEGIPQGNADKQIQLTEAYQQIFATDSGNGYVDKYDYPVADTLTLFRETAYAIILQNCRGTPGSAHVDYLRGLEYRMVELMIDEEQGRMTEEGRPVYIPRDYLYERDRIQLASIGSSGFTRGTSH